MSYCVNCGVELAETEKSCPLCFTEVINPKKPFDPTVPPLYPDIPVRGVITDNRHLLAPFALLMLTPTALCLVIELMTSGKLSWSLYVLLSMLLLDVFLLPPLAMRRRLPMLCLAIDWAATAAFLFVLDILTPGSWFMPVALPFLIGGGAITMGAGAMLLYVKMFRRLRLTVTLFATGALVLLGDILIKRYRGAPRPVGWSLLVLTPCVILGIIGLMLNHNQRLKEEVDQRFFV